MNITNFIRQVPFIPGSLSDPSNADGLRAVMTNTRARLAVEVGSFLACGSTRVIGEHLQKVGGHLICVDTLSVNVAARGLGTVAHPQAFYSNLRHLGLADTVLVWRGTSEEAAGALDVKADFVYIDADHSEPGVWQDIKLWAPHVLDGGVLCGDDANLPHLPGVDAALNRLRKAVQVWTTGRFWWTPPLTEAMRAAIAQA